MRDTSLEREILFEVLLDTLWPSLTSYQEEDKKIDYKYSFYSQIPFLGLAALFNYKPTVPKRVH